MSPIIDHILSEVCLDPRVKDGIFKLDEEQHMDALRDYLVKGGLTLDEIREITNRMMENLKYPDRQAVRKKDGIIITWPSVEYKQKAFKEHPGEYIEWEEAVRLGIVQRKKEPEEPEKREPLTPREPAGEPKALPKEPGPQSVFQGDQELSVEPVRGSEKPESPPTPPTSPVIAPTTPEKKAAEKAVVQQMMQVDDLAKSKFYPTIAELYEKAEKQGLKETAEFLKQYVNT